MATENQQWVRDTKLFIGGKLAKQPELATYIRFEGTLGFKSKKRDAELEMYLTRNATRWTDVEGNRYREYAGKDSKNKKLRVYLLDGAEKMRESADILFCCSCPIFTRTKYCDHGYFVLSEIKAGKLNDVISADDYFKIRGEAQLSIERVNVHPNASVAKRARLNWKENQPVERIADQWTRAEKYTHLVRFDEFEATGDFIADSEGNIYECYVYPATCRGERACTVFLHADIDAIERNIKAGKNQDSVIRFVCDCPFWYSCEHGPLIFKTLLSEKLYHALLTGDRSQYDPDHFTPARPTRSEIHDVQRAFNLAQQFVDGDFGITPLEASVLNSVLGQIMRGQKSNTPQPILQRQSAKGAANASV